MSEKSVELLKQGDDEMNGDTICIPQLPQFEPIAMQFNGEEFSITSAAEKAFIDHILARLSDSEAKYKTLAKAVNGSL